MLSIHCRCSGIKGIRVHTNVETGSGQPGRVNRVTFSPGHPGLTWFTNYPDLTWIGSREKRNCSFDNVEIINAIAKLFHEPRPLIMYTRSATPIY